MSKWKYDVPKDKCSVSEQKAFALQKPYTGRFTLGSQMKRKITEKDKQNSLRLFTLSSEVPLPSDFTWRDKAGIIPPRNQAGCGCCWSFAIASALGDRYFIKYQKDHNLKDIIYLSPTWLVTIAYNFFSELFGSRINGNNTCDTGGDPFSVCEFLEMTADEAKKNGYLNVEPGVKLDICWPYQLITGKNGNNKGTWIFPDNLANTNNQACWNCTDPNVLKDKDKILFKIRKGGVKNLLVMSGKTINREGTIKAIQKDLQFNGPMVCGFQTFDSFMKYWKNLKPTPNKKPEKLSDIYLAPQGERSQGGHAVTIVGWGTFPNSDRRINNGKPIRYWVMRNSWGTNSADGGYGYIAFSTDYQPNTKLEVDVPQEVDYDRQGNIIWQGGMFGITPGDFPNKYLEYFNKNIKDDKNIKNITSKPDQNVVSQDKKCVCDNKKFRSVFTNLNTGENVLLIILAVLAVALIAYGLYRMKTKQ
jgi:hypothetical protein